MLKHVTIVEKLSPLSHILSISVSVPHVGVIRVAGYAITPKNPANYAITPTADYAITPKHPGNYAITPKYRPDYAIMPIKA